MTGPQVLHFVITGKNTKTLCLPFDFDLAEGFVPVQTNVCKTSVLSKDRV